MERSEKYSSIVLYSYSSESEKVDVLTIYKSSIFKLLPFPWYCVVFNEFLISTLHFVAAHGLKSELYEPR